VKEFLAATRIRRLETNMAPANEKKQAHELLDQLTPGQFAAIVHLLRVMTDPLARSLADAPVDDEPVTEQEAAEIAAARASLDRGAGISHDQVLAEFGLSREDFERMGHTPLPPHKGDR
jgi:hypothetical protein